MERLDVLIRQARAQTGNQVYSATQGIPQRDFVRWANDAQQRIYNLLLQKRSSLFVKEGLLDVEAGEAEVDLPTDVHLSHNVVSVEYSPTGVARDFYPLELRTLRQRSSASGHPTSYFLRGGKIVLSPIPPASISDALRVNYQYTLPTLDIRRASVSVDDITAQLEFSTLSSGALSFGGGATVACSTHGNGIFLAGSSTGGGIARSTDGTTWTVYAAAAGSLRHRGMLYAGGLFFVYGEGGIYTSTDGITWTARHNFGADSVRGIAYGAGVFVAIGQSGESARSTDGLTWTDTSVGTILQVVAYSEDLGVFAALGGGGAGAEILYSYDGIYWQTGSGAPNVVWTSLAVGNGQFFACGASGTLAISSDGVTWTTPTTGIAAATTVRGAVYGEGAWLVGYKNESGPIDGGVVRSTDGGVSFTEVLSEECFAIHFLGGTFFACSSGVIVRYSTDGVTWTAIKPDFVYQTASTGNGTGAYYSGDTLTFIGLTGSATLSASPSTTYTLTLSGVLAESEQDFADEMVDYICVVAQDGSQSLIGAAVGGYDATTDVLTITTDEDISDSLVGYLTFGRNSTTHSSLVDVSERYLVEYMALRAQMRDSNAESAETALALQSLEKEILDGIEQLEEDLPTIPILDSSMLNYADDWE